MCRSKKQVEANRENAQKSTGPKTDEGKKTSSQNAIRHGLNAVDIIIDSPHLKESQSDYDILVASLIDELEPRSTLQQHLVYKIANCYWRYRRVINAETAQINKQLNISRLKRLNPYFLQHMENTDELINHLQSETIPTDESAELLRRYESRLERELHHAHRLLRQLQSIENRPTIKKSQNEPISPEPFTQQRHTPANSHPEYASPAPWSEIPSSSPGYYNRVPESARPQNQNNGAKT